MAQISTPALTEHRLLEVAGETSFARGEDYVRFVHRLRVADGRATATIQAKRVYLVDLDWSGKRLVGTCTCPFFGKGAFCKHLVALGLAALDDIGERPRLAAESTDPIQDWLEIQDAELLRAL